MTKRYDKEPEVGSIFGKLKIVENSTLHNGRRYIKVRCECGVEKSTRLDAILKGATVSCGCHRDTQNKVASLKHGHSGKSRSGIYNSWSCMLQRTKPTSRFAAYYADRGIRVCERWKIFENFLEDMEPFWFSGATLERLDVNLGYFLENCTWVTKAEQSQNTRRSYEFDYKGERHTLATLAKKLNIPEHRLRYRVRANSDASVEEIVSAMESGKGRKTCFTADSALRKYTKEL